MTQLLAIQPGMVAAIRTAIGWRRDTTFKHATVDYGIPHTTAERPWAVVAEDPKEGP